MMRSATAPTRDAYREGAAAGYRAVSPSSDAAANASMAGPSGGGPPGWARDLAHRQRLTQAGMITAQALREGDRPSGSSGPNLKPNN
jgi:type IV secretory pathway TrbL component